MAKVGVQVEAEPTAAQRLATARAGLEKLMIERAAAGDAKRAAQVQYDELDAKLMAIHRQGDVYGEDVALAVADVTTQRQEAARQIGLASAEFGNLNRRMAAINEELPRLEAAALQDDLAIAVDTGKAAARRYKEALERMLEAAVELHAEIGRCDRLSDAIARKWGEPQHKLAAHPIDGDRLDQVLLVARTNNFDPAPVDAAIARLFERWHI